MENATLNVEDNLFLAAQRGDIDTIQRLISTEVCTVFDRDHENTTALHCTNLLIKGPL